MPMGFSIAGGQRSLASKRSAISLHDQQPVEPYTDEPNDDPPAYTDEIPGSSNQIQSTLPDLPPVQSYINPYPDIQDSRLVDTFSRRESYLVTLCPDLTTSPETLYETIYRQAKVAPTVLISVKGTHTVKQRDGRNKESSSTVTDFDFQIETRGTILSMDSYWAERDPPFDHYRRLNVVRDGDRKSAYRGGRFKSKASKKYKPSESDPEQATSERIDDVLREWCLRYCEDKSGVKSFTLHNKVEGLNMDIIKAEITSIIRATKYCGSIHVNQVTTHTALTVYSPHWINKLRTNRFVWWVVVILQLWIIAWPIIILLEKRYEPVTAEYIVSEGGVHVSPFRGELSWTEMFAPAISAAAISRRKDGEMVTMGDVRRIRESPVNGGSRLDESPAERDRRARLNSGNGTFMDSLVGLARGISDLRNEYDHTRGWGANE
ncbi:hypothetical protein McanMca71_004183 [Microsporum canis]